MFKTMDFDAVEYTFFDGKNNIPYVGEIVECVEEYRRVLPPATI